tara:strand:- start:74 stop:415 length:342 start_codon:yes stop_codon:yes gene_type:complete
VTTVPPLNIYTINLWRLKENGWQNDEDSKQNRFFRDIPDAPRKTFPTPVCVHRDYECKPQDFNPTRFGRYFDRRDITLRASYGHGHEKLELSWSPFFGLKESFAMPGAYLHPE